MFVFKHTNAFGVCSIVVYCLMRCTLCFFGRLCVCALLTPMRVVCAVSGVLYDAVLRLCMWFTYTRVLFEIYCASTCVCVCLWLVVFGCCPCGLSTQVCVVLCMV